MSGFDIDIGRLREAFDQAASSYDDHAVLQHEVGDRMLERLDYVRLNPQLILDVGCGTGRGSEALLKRYAGSRVVGLDLSPGMLGHARRRGRWRRRPAVVCGDVRQLPVGAERVDLIYSNLTLQWCCADLDRVLAEFRRVLRRRGLLMFTSFGPDTLKELRASWGRVDGRPHVNDFLDMHDIGDALLRSGFADPVMDMEMLTVTYADPLDLMRDLKRIGAVNVNAGRQRGLMGREHLRAVCEAYEAFRLPDGRYPATYEVIYGQAWVPDAPPPMQMSPGVIPIIQK
ncbi:MAG: malonyl-ACP O-methyltransferase BioC [Gammaproteobacteria bacterium]|jgi:malonyl-CoA O-methyltransferase